MKQVVAADLLNTEKGQRLQLRLARVVFLYGWVEGKVDGMRGIGNGWGLTAARIISCSLNDQSGG